MLRRWEVCKDPRVAEGLGSGLKGSSKREQPRDTSNTHTSITMQLY